MQGLAGRVALITGAAEPYGRAIALGFADQGARLVLADPDKDWLLGLQKELDGGACDCIALQVDVTDEDSVKNAVQESLSRFQRIDILVNGVSQKASAALEDLQEGDWDTCIRINLVSAFLWSKALVPAMLDQRYGRIINIAPVDPLSGCKDAAHYAAAKFGIIGFSKALALELALHQITVNTICIDENWTEGPTANAIYSPSGQDSAGPALYLAGDDGSYVTGQVLFVNAATAAK